MERIRHSDGSLDAACQFCPARVFVGPDDYCDPLRLDNKNIILKVARYRPDNCPRNVKADCRGEPAEIILRKMLRK